MCLPENADHEHLTYHLRLYIYVYFFNGSFLVISILLVDVLPIEAYRG